MTYETSNVLRLRAIMALPRFVEDIWEQIDKAEALGDNSLSFTLPNNVFLAEKLEAELLKSKTLRSVHIQELNGAYLLSVKWTRKKGK